MYKLMVVDDDTNILNALLRVLTNQTTWEIEIYTNPKQALKRAATSLFDLYLTDYRMPEMNGVQLLTEIKNIQPESPRIILSAFAELDGVMAAINEAEIYRFINKPWNNYDLISALRQALDYRDIVVENRRLADQVRQQTIAIQQRNQFFENLKTKHPELLDVKFDADGSVLLEK